MPDGGALNPAATRLAGVPCACLRVRDNGPGIDPALLDRIFEPFFTTKGSRGSGLGLAMARDAVRRHDGAIRALSSPGAGATFEVLLPLTEPTTKPNVTQNQAS